MEIKDKIAVDYWLSRLGQYQPLTFGPGRDQMGQPIPALLMQKIDRLFTGAHVDTGKFLFYQWGFKLMLNIYTGCTDIVLACSGADQRFIFLRSSVNETMTVKDSLLHEQRGWVASLPYANVDYPAFIKKYEMNGLGAESHLLRFGFGYGARGQNRDMFSRTEWGLDIQITGPTEAQLIMHYPTAVFDGRTAGMFLENYLTLLSSMAEDTGTPVGALDFLAADQKQMVETFSRPEAVFPISETVMQRFLQQAALTPDKTAVVFGGRSLTYAGLQAKAMTVAWRLKYMHGVEAGDTVAMMLYRSEYLAIAVLGILWAGGIYVAVDPDYPPERRSFICKDCGAKMILTEQFFLEEEKEYQDETLPLAVTDPSAGAFIIYTSGSTGTPKGILQTHRCLFNTVMRQVDHGGFERELRVLQYSSIGFDVFIAHELFFTLLSAGTLYLVKEEQRRDLAVLGKYILDNGIQWLLLPVSAWNTIVEVSDHLWQETLTLVHVVSAGEQLRLNGTFSRWLKQRPGIRLHNFYGPSETHNASNYLVDTTRLLQTDQPIGRPAANTWIYILSPSRRPVPAGVIGEIYISGAGLAAGYVNQPGLEAEKFLPNPWIPGERMYRTGDLGQWLHDGNILFNGRIDDMVKIRGQRVETGEIEHRLLNFEGIRQCAVVPLTQHQSQVLVAYLAAMEKIDAIQLREYLQQHLPDYMIPSFFVRMDRLPLNANGKIDKRHLPLPGEGGEMLGADYLPPRTPTEKKLVSIWKDILGLQPIGIKDNFFEAGGHSLSAMRLAGELYRRMNVSLTLKDLMACAVLEDQARLIDMAEKVNYTPIPCAPWQAHYPLSSAQRRIWLLSLMENGSAAYNMPGLYLVKGKLDVGRLDLAAVLLIQRHESLRTVFREDNNGEPAQFIRPAEKVEGIVVQIDCRDMDRAERERLINEFICRPFDMASGPLLRLQACRLEDDEWLLCFAMHHIVGDGWSMDILINDFTAFYRRQGIEGAPEPLRIQYKDYAVWQQQRLKDEAMQTHRAYWLQQMGGDLPMLQLPADGPRPAEKTYAGGVVGLTIPSATLRGIKDICRQEEATLFMGMLAAVNMLLYRLSGQSDIIVGAPAAGRDHPDLERQIGLFLNSLALRARFSGANSFRELLQIVKQVTLEAYAHQDYPFDRLIAELPLPGDRSRNPLFDVSVVWMDKDSSRLEGDLDGLAIRPVTEPVAAFSKFDLSFGFKEVAGDMEITIEYNSDVYAAASIKRWARHLRQLLVAATQNPDMPVGGLNILTAEEQRQLLLQPQTVLDLFDRQVTAMPDAIALIRAGREMTYRQLDESTDRLAAWLLENYTLVPDDRVAIKLPRGEWLVPAIFAILKAGAAYIPIDPDYPQERIDYIVSHSQCKLLLDEEEISRFLQAGPTMCSPRPPTPASLAYVIYTSGSTGTPKGCSITHRSLFNYIDWANRYYFPDGTRGSFGLFTSLSFDLTVTSIFCPLTMGRTLTVFDRDMPLDEIFARHFDAGSGIDCIKLTPSHINLLKHLDLQSSTMRCVIVGGEQVTQGHVSILKKINPAIRIYNEYGPTEATVGCVIKELEPGTPVLIGRPIANTRAYVLNEYQVLCPPGIAGELYLAGAGLAREYLNDPVLTARKFVADPFVPGERMYKTGDICKWLPDGELFYAGRMDDQVKVRGYRIEPGDIEHALSLHPSVDTAVVMADASTERDTELTCYLVGRDGVSGAELRDHLRRHLPAYMIPASFVQLNNLPLTSNGKVDKGRLAGSKGIELRAAMEYIAPRNSIEKKLADLWEEVLDRKMIGIRDNFFDLGGHSVKAAQLISRINAAFSVRINIQSIFNEPTIENISENIAFLLEQHKQRAGRENMVRIQL